jgi:integrase
MHNIGDITSLADLDGLQGEVSSGNLRQFVEEKVFSEAMTRHYRNHHNYAITCLFDFLNREPLIEDLTSDTIRRCLVWMFEAGRSFSTVKNYRRTILAVAREAFNEKLLAEMPSVPWTLQPSDPIVKPTRFEPIAEWQLQRLLGSARTQKGTIDGIPEGRWFAALFMLILDTSISLDEALEAKFTDFRIKLGRLTVGSHSWRLHSETVEALRGIYHFARPGKMLFPWPCDNGQAGPTFRIHLEKVLSRAGMTDSLSVFFGRLQVTGINTPGILDRLTLSTVAIRPVDADVQSVDVLPASTTPGGVTLRSFITDMYVPSRLDLSEKSAEQLTIAVTLLDRWAKREILTTDLTPQLILGFLKHLSSIGRSASTVNGKRQSLITLWRSAHKKGLAQSPPDADDLPKKRSTKKIPVAWSIEELNLILETCRSLVGNNKNSGIRRRYFWSSLVLFMYETGTRLNATLAIKSSDINLDSKAVILRTESAKTGLEQWHKLSDQCTEAIACHYNADREMVWPWSQHRQCLYASFKSILTKAGLPKDRYRQFHCIRRTTATWAAIHGGVDLARHTLGHTSQTMTVNNYIDPRFFRRQSAADVLPALNEAAK